MNTDIILSKLRGQVLDLKQAYGLDIFPNSEVLNDASSRDSISAKMGRHMCDVFLRFIDEAASELEDQNE
jgi:hypothetical protein